MESRTGFFFVAHLVRTRQQWGDMAGIGFITQLVNHQLPWGTTPRGGSFGRHSCAFSDSFEHPQCRLGQINVGVWTSMKQRINRWLATCGLAWFNGSLQNLRIQTRESWFMVFVWAFRCISKSCNHWELFDVQCVNDGIIWMCPCPDKIISVSSSRSGSHFAVPSIVCGYFVWWETCPSTVIGFRALSVVDRSC